MPELTYETPKIENPQYRFFHIGSSLALLIFFPVAMIIPDSIFPFSQSHLAPMILLIIQFPTHSPLQCTVNAAAWIALLAPWCALSLTRRSRADFLIPLLCTCALLAVWLLYAFFNGPPLLSVLASLPFLTISLAILIIGIEQCLKRKPPPQ